MKSRTRPKLLSLDGEAGVQRYLLKREDLTLESAAMRLLCELNRHLTAHGLTFAGKPIQARVYKVLPISVSAGLVEFVPGFVSLGKLKWRADVF
jgi:phosphatidylinositol kinase/protein kinase (PI-3  family)